MNKDLYIKQLEATIERLEKNLKGYRELEEFRTLYAQVLEMFARHQDTNVANDRISEATDYINNYPMFPPPKTSIARRCKDLVEYMKKKGEKNGKK